MTETRDRLGENLLRTQCNEDRKWFITTKKKDKNETVVKENDVCLAYDHNNKSTENVVQQLIWLTRQEEESRKGNPQNFRRAEGYLTVTKKHWKISYRKLIRNEEWNCWKKAWTWKKLEGCEAYFVQEGACLREINQNIIIKPVL